MKNINNKNNGGFTPLLEYLAVSRPRKYSQGGSCLPRNLMSRGQATGFTLIELLIVIAIIGILASIVLVSMSSTREKARLSKAAETVRQIRTAVILLESDTDQWPGHKNIEAVEPGAGGNEIWDLNAPSVGLVATDGNFPGWAGPYIRHIPTDPWGNNYFFDTDYDIDPGGGTVWATVVGSFGPNGQGQNIYDSDNIIDIIVARF